MLIKSNTSDIIGQYYTRTLIALPSDPQNSQQTRNPRITASIAEIEGINQKPRPRARACKPALHATENEGPLMGAHAPPSIDLLGPGVAAQAQSTTYPIYRQMRFHAPRGRPARRAAANGRRSSGPRDDILRGWPRRVPR